MNKTEIVLIGVIIIVVIISGNQIYQDNLKINFLENELATKNLHYEYLLDLMEGVLQNREIPQIMSSEINDKI